MPRRSVGDREHDAAARTAVLTTTGRQWQRSGERRALSLGVRCAHWQGMAIVADVWPIVVSFRHRGRGTT
ncbi:hypothetical protein ACILG0_19625 [Pseudomonadota bacterium AL_CKDN230030165-1A_HGKHYDSX7]